MIQRKLDEITESDLSSLISDNVAEGKTIEYKQVLPGNSDSDKKEFLADLSSFSNTGGGDLIYGIKEQRGLPVEVVGLDGADSDAEINRLENMAMSGIEPRIACVMRSVLLANGKFAIVVRIKQSWVKPHRVVFAGHDKFYGRHSGGKYPLDVVELRDAFTLSDTITKRIQDFRYSRIMEIEADKAPLPISGENKIIIHIVPLESFSTKIDIKIDEMFNLPNRTEIFRPMYASGWFAPEINLHGFISYAGETRGAARSYVQLFRNGVIEVVESSILERDENIIPTYVVEKEILEAVGRYIGALKLLELNTPIFVFISLTNIKGFSVPFDRIAYIDKPESIREENLHLPEAVFEDYDQAVGTTLKPIFDLVWNACGIKGSRNFDQDGNWITR